MHDFLLGLCLGTALGMVTAYIIGGVLVSDSVNECRRINNVYDCIPADPQYIPAPQEIKHD